MGEKKWSYVKTLLVKKALTAPLKTLNLQRSHREIYNACPFCLTELKIPEKQEEIQLENLKSEATHKGKLKKNLIKITITQQHAIFILAISVKGHRKIIFQMNALCARISLNVC